VHPGYAKGKLANSMKAAGKLLSTLPREAAPETTEGRQGYLHPIAVTGNVEKTVVRLIIRDFEEVGLESLSGRLATLASEAADMYPGVTVDAEIKHQYRNMKLLLDREPHVVKLALEAVRRAGGQPTLASIRGGTDGARLTFMGLLTPNIFTGGHNFHSRTEWISIQDMELAVRTLVELVRLWEQIDGF